MPRVGTWDAVTRVLGMAEGIWRALWWPGPATALLAAVLALVVARFVVPRLPEPLPDPADPFTKPTYASLRRPGVIVPALVLGGLAGLLAPLAGPLTGAAVVLAGAGAALVCVDAATTYLPSLLHWGCVVGVTAAGLGGVLLSGPETRWATVLMGAAFGSTAAFALFWLLWRLGDGFGYGDVRLAALTGGFTGAVGLQTWWHSLVAATLLGALAGLAVAWWRRRHPSALGTAFPYGPALWAGPFVGLLLGG